MSDHLTDWKAKKEIERLTRIEEKYTNLCDVLNDQTKEIERLEAGGQEAFNIDIKHQEEIERLTEELTACREALLEALGADDE